MSFISNLFGGGGGGGGGGGTPTQTQSTSYQTNIPEYAKPYVTNMLNATQNQLFKTNESGDITGFQPYKAYGGTYDAQGNQISYDPSKAVAGFSPMQQQAQQSAANLQVPGQYGQATDMATMSGMGALGTAGQAGMYGAQGNMAGQRAANLSNMYGGAGAQAGQQAAGMSNMYGGLGAMSGQQYANQSAGAGQQGANIGQQYGGQSSMYGGLGAMQGMQGANIGQSLGQMSTNANAQQAYMNPYLQNALNPQLAEIQRQYDITGTQQQSQAARSGAFGGSREALMAAENQRNKNTAMNQVIGQGYNQAFTNAQQQMNAANQAALAGNQQALSGYGMGLQGAGQAGNLALQGNQQALSGYGQAGSQALAGYGMGLQGAGQAGQQAMQGYGMGLQGAGQAGSQAMQGAGLGLQGVGAQQNAYNQLGAAGANLANIGGQQLQAQQGIIGTQNQLGTQQQANQQQIINQAMQDYANAQQYPLMQLGTYSNMLRGLPMQAQTTNQYVAAPNPITQGISLAGAGASLYNATKGAKGGIMSYNAGGAIRATLEDMSNESLQQYLKTASSDTVKNDIKEVLAQRTMAGVKPAKNGGILSYAKPTEENNEGVTTSKYANPQIAADAAMYEKAGNYISGIPNRVMNAVNPIGIVQAGKDLINWGQTDTRQQFKDTYPERYARNQEKLAAEKGMIRPTDVETPTKNNDWEGSTNLSNVTTKGNKTEEVKLPVKPQANPQTNPQVRPQAPTNPNAITSAKPVMPTSVQNQGVDTSNFGAGPEPTDPNLGKTVQQIMAEREAILGANTGAQEQRAKLMAERANAKDESNRTFNLRMAEFFSLWGTTPGSTITAGLNALKTKIPDFIGDKKEERKVRMEIDKSIHSLDEADRLEKAGNYDGAQKIRADAVKTSKDTWAKKLEAGYHKYDADVRAASAKYVADRNLEGDIYKANATASKGGGNDRLIDRAEDNLRAVEGQIDAVKKSEPYKNNENIVKRGLPKDASPRMTERYNNAKESLNATNAELASRKQRAQAEYDRARGVKSETPEPKNKPKPINLDKI